MTYISMPANPKLGLKGKVDPQALHVLLSSPNLPLHYVVYDGDKFWFFNPINGWESRKEFKGATDYLWVLPSHTVFAFDLPFKIRDIRPEQSHQRWYQYQNSLKK